MWAKLSSHWIGTNYFEVTIENERFTVVFSRCRQNLKFSYFTSLGTLTSKTATAAKTSDTPYSKMAATLVFFCLIANWPFWPRFQTQNSKEHFTLNVAKRANLQSNKRILKWRNKVYSASLCFLKCFVIIPVCSTSTNYPNYPGTELGGTVTKLSKKIKYLPFCARVFLRTWAMIISRCRLAENGKEMYLQSRCFAHQCLLFGGVLAEVAVLDLKVAIILQSTEKE